MRENLFDGVLSKAPKHNYQSGPKKDFWPWHHPRKQCIRKCQWNSEIAKLLDRLNISDGRSVRYMTLPGNDLLDIRVLHDEFERRSEKLLYFGFNPAMKDKKYSLEINLSHNEVRSLPQIDGDSRILSDDIRSLAIKNSNVFEELKKQNGFDAINLDLCNSIVGEQPGKIGSYYDTLLELFKEQADKRFAPWLLFLSTHISRESVNHEAMERLIKVLANNIEKSSEFRSELQAKLSTSVEELEDSILKMLNDDSRNSENESISWDEVIKCFCLGLGKWFLKIMLGAFPQWKVTLERSYCYSVSGYQKDFVSLSFLFEPLRQLRPDPVGLSSVSTAISSSGSDEIDAAINMISCACGLNDVDKYLDDNPDFMKKMVAEKKALLGSCRYESADYLNWLNEQGIASG